MRIEQSEVTAVGFPSNITKMGGKSRNRISWPILTISKAERWLVKKTKGIDLNTDRVLRFYTYNDMEHQDFEFIVPKYVSDLVTCLYSAFVKAGNVIGKTIRDEFGIKGAYQYDVQVTIEPSKDFLYNDSDIIQNNLSFSWRILRTDNPRCVFGDPTVRKDCSYLNQPLESKLTIDGYVLSGNYQEIMDVVSDLATRTVITHSQEDVLALMEITKFLGAVAVSNGPIVYKNEPHRVAHFSPGAFGFRLDKVNGRITLKAIRKEVMNTAPEDVLDIDELIVRRSLSSILKEVKEID